MRPSTCWSPSRRTGATVTDLAIVIVSYNTREDLDDCLRSLHDAPPDVHHEIVVVDNASPDGSAAAVRSGWPRVRVLDAGGNLGYARANNHGIRATSSDFILLLNSDTIVPAGAIDALLGRLRSTPSSERSGLGWSTATARRSYRSAEWSARSRSFCRSANVRARQQPPVARVAGTCVVRDTVGPGLGQRGVPSRSTFRRRASRAPR